MLGFVLGYFVFAAYMTMKTEINIIEFIVSMVFFGGGIFCVMIFSVVSQSMERIAFAEFQQRHNESHDSLTGLPNRSFLLQTINQHINDYGTTQQRFGVATVDINNFNHINEVFGHTAGDSVLYQYSERLKEFVDLDIFLARTSGNRFTFIISSPETTNVATYIENIQAYLDHPLTINDHDINFTNTVGVSLYPEHAASAEDILKRSEIAMYSAKRIQIPYAIYEAVSYRQFYDKVELAQMLQVAMKNMDFDLYFQPVMNVNNSKKTTFEVLIRWPLGNGYSVSPDEFIPIAEQTNAIQHITRWVLQKTASQLAVWANKGMTPHVQVNLSVKDIVDDYLEPYLKNC